MFAGQMGSAPRLHQEAHQWVGHGVIRGSVGYHPRPFLGVGHYKSLSVWKALRSFSLGFKPHHTEVKTKLFQK